MSDYSITEPLVSVLIPCFDAEKFVGEAVDSALSQTYGRVEVVVVDDGSADRSLDVVRSFGNRVVSVAAPNRGACAARNLAFEFSRGEYIQFLDADDLLVSNKIEKQLPALIEGAADLVFCKGILFGDGKPPRPKKRPIAPPAGIDPFVYCLRQGLGIEGPLHRRSSLAKVGLFRPHLKRAQELDLHLRLAASDVRIHLLDDLLYLVRDHAGPRITRSKLPADHFLNLLLELTEILNSGAPYEMNDERRAALAGCVMQHSIHAYRNGAERSAEHGFARALRLSPDAEFEERGWYKRASRVAGPLAVEWALKQARRARGRLGKLSRVGGAG